MNTTVMSLIEQVFALAKVHPGYSITIGMILGFANDYMYACYIQSVADKKPFAACNWSLAITILCMCVTVSLIQGAMLLVGSYLVGGYGGTWLATKRSV